MMEKGEGAIARKTMNMYTNRLRERVGGRQQPSPRCFVVVKGAWAQWIRFMITLCETKK